MKQIRVLLAEDHTVVREGLKVLLQSEGDILVVGEACTGRQALRLARELLPDVIVMDIAMPGLNGLEATRLIIKELPEARVLVLSAHGDEGYLERAVTLGAAGYLLKQTSARILSQAVREIAMGNRFFSPSLACRVNEALGPVPDQGKTDSATGAQLSSREVQVLQLIAEGRPNKQVAAELGISIKTVEKHRQHLMDRLSIHDIAGLTRYAVAAGIIESSVQRTVIRDAG